MKGILLTDRPPPGIVIRNHYVIGVIRTHNASVLRFRMRENGACRTKISISNATNRQQDYIVTLKLPGQTTSLRLLIKYPM